MTNVNITAAAAEILKAKLAAAGAEPSPEDLQAAIGVGGGAGAQGGDISALLSSLPPEQLEQLATELAADMQNPGAGQGGEDVAGLAKAIEAHLGQNPEASVQGAPAEKAAELSNLKTASFIEGFLQTGIDAGASSEQAVNAYDYMLSAKLAETREFVKQAAASQVNEKTAAYFDGIASRAAEYGLTEAQTVELLKSAAPFEVPHLDPAGGYEPDGFMQGDPGSTVSGGRHLTPYNFEPEEEAAGNTSSAPVGMGDTPHPALLDQLKALGHKGVASAQQLGHDVSARAHAAAPHIKDFLAKLMGNHAEQDGDGQAGSGILGGMDYLKGLGQQGLQFAQQHHQALGIGAAGLGGAYLLHKLLAHNKHSNTPEGREVTAAYIDGVVKRAAALGFNEAQVAQLIEQSAR